jgi:hypothetical protein
MADVQCALNTLRTCMIVVLPGDVLSDHIISTGLSKLQYRSR